MTGVCKRSAERSHFWGPYAAISQSYPKLSLEAERVLIARAQRGSTKSRDELVLRHLGFVIFRLHRKLLPGYLRNCGPDFLSASIPMLYRKVKTYDLAYVDREGKPKPVKFASYLWKSVDGFIIKSINEVRQSEGLLLDESC